MEKIIWKSDQYGGSKRANLGHDFKLVATYPLTGEEHTGYVLSLCVGKFKTQEEAMTTCEEIAVEIIKDLHKNYVNTS